LFSNGRYGQQKTKKGPLKKQPKGGEKAKDGPLLKKQKKRKSSTL